MVRKVKVVVGTETDGSGELSTGEYDNAVRDLVNFLVYSVTQYSLNATLSGLVGNGLLSNLHYHCDFLLKKEYWRDVHHQHRANSQIMLLLFNGGFIRFCI